MNWQWSAVIAAYLVLVHGCTDDIHAPAEFVALPYVYGAGKGGIAEGECQLGSDPGLSAWLCLQGLAPAVPPSSEGHRGHVYVRVTTHDECPTTGEPGWVTYGCWDSASVNDPMNKIVVHAHTVGPNSVCPHGTPMDSYTPQCWRQFYAVLAHEIEHDVFGPSHGHRR